MTAHQDLKKIIRERQRKTGESYTAARQHVMRERAVLLGLESEASVLSKPVRAEAAVLKVNQQSARIRLVGADGHVTFRSQDVWKAVPGHLVTLVIEKRWTWRDDAYASGRLENPRIDIEKLGLVPLPLTGGELKDLRPAYEPYRSPDPYAPMWRKLKAKRRAWYELDPIAWGAFPEADDDENPTCDAAELAAAGDREGARKILMAVLATDLRWRRARPPRQPGVRAFPRAGDSPLRDRHPHRGAVTAGRFRRRARLGAHLQPALLALPPRLRALPLASEQAR
jgi:hypothetical protein